MLSDEKGMNCKHFINVVKTVFYIYAIHKPRLMLRAMNQTFIPPTQ